MTEPNNSLTRGSAIVAGVGPGLGLALCNRFSADGLNVLAIARNRDGLSDLIAGSSYADRITPMACDVTDADAMEEAVSRAEEVGALELSVFNAGAFVHGGLLDLDTAELDRCWRVGCRGAVNLARSSIAAMLPRRRGTVLFTGATAALRGSAGFAALAIPKFGLRALAQSAAREFGPQGIHVAHVVIDGGMGEDTGLLSEDQTSPDSSLSHEAVAAAYAMLHAQHRSAWTHELDLRPWVERF